MKRRQLFGYGAAATSAAALASCGAATTTSGAGTTGSDLPIVTWQMATSWPKSLDTIFGGAQTIADRVSAMTGGRFTIEPFAAGEIVPGLEVLNAVESGTVACGHSAAYYYVGKNSALAFGTAVPFGLNAQQQNAWYYHGGGLEAMHKLYSDFNAICFPAGNTGVQMGGWFNKQIQTAADLNGLKMRIPGLGGKVMSRLGVNAQSLPGGEVFVALERGAIDAAEWVGPYDDEKLGLQNAADYYYYPGWWEPGPTLDLTINLNEWNKLPTEYQEVIQAAAFEANTNMLAKYDALNGAALKRLVDGGTTLVAYSPEIMAAAEKASFELFEESAIENPSFQEIYSSWKKFRDEVYAWNKLNEVSFSTFANKA